MDMRVGDIVDVAGGVAEVIKMEANADGGFYVTLRFAESEAELRPSVLMGRGRIKHGKGAPPGLLKPKPEEPEVEEPEPVEE